MSDSHQRIQELVGEHNYDAMKASVMEIVSTHFRPEFINRVDELVVTMEQEALKMVEAIHGPENEKA